ncbi:hypothetical protein AB6A40_010417 [Gnathostoma spinigerum]|uniref:Uncharacterized protein n=1 Tax=Gnathostoma spinigerum TaxID=75299 RepID=A0ABD6EUT2_9BILA
MLRACTTENENSAAKNRLGSSSRWVTEVAKELSRDLASSKRRFAVELSKKSAYSEVIRYAVRDNYHSLLSYTLQFLEAVDSHSTGYRGDDQFFAIIIMLAARGMEHYTVDAPLADSVEAVSLFHSLSMLFERLPSLGNDSCAAWVYLLDRIEKWADIRSIDERSSDIDRTVVQIQRKLTQK